VNALVLPMDGDQKRVEQALPGFMFALMFESLQGQGLEVRQDLVELSDKASAAALHGTYGAHQQKLAGIVADHGYGILKHAGSDDNLPLLIGSLSRLLVVLRDRGVVVEENALLVALSICTEIDEGFEEWGKPQSMKRVMAGIDREARSKGYFSTLTG
jgi:hypothetical protein